MKQDTGGDLKLGITFRKNDTCVVHLRKTVQSHDTVFAQGLVWRLFRFLPPSLFHVPPSPSLHVLYVSFLSSEPLFVFSSPLLTPPQLQLYLCFLFLFLCFFFYTLRSFSHPSLFSLIFSVFVRFNFLAFGKFVVYVTR